MALGSRLSGSMPAHITHTISTTSIINTTTTTPRQLLQLPLPRWQRQRQSQQPWLLRPQPLQQQGGA